VYLLARFAPAFAAVGAWRPIVVVVGGFTMIAGGLRALRPRDLKQLLAFGTIGQLGFLTVLLGIGQPEATTAGCALLLAHALFKASLFMVVGIVDHEAHTRDIDRLPLLGRGWGPTRAVMVISAASMAAVPPLAGFIAKEEAYAAFVHGPGADRAVLAVIVVGSVFTAVYSLRLAVALWRPDLVSEQTVDRPVLDGGPSPAFLAPAALLALATVLLGVVPAAWSGLVDHAANALDPAAGTHLAVWHGLSAALLLSLLTLAAGAVIFASRRVVARVQARLAPAHTGADAYAAAVDLVLRLSAWVTRFVQSGSLPIYAAVIMTTAAIVPAAALLSGDGWPGWPRVVGRSADLPVVALLVAGATAATLATRRFAAALLLGVVGYGMAVLFFVQGAPDLALTQFAVETLSVVVFLLVLRRLPDRFERRAPAVGTVPRLAVSSAVGGFVVLMALAASGARTRSPVSEEMADLAYAEGDGRNVVNVILVDIRGLDTLGEVTVLVAAGIGIVALARAGERPRSRPSRRFTGLRRASPS
jgi:multicomponent Na+:H+ antiporter subunit A